DRVAALVPTEDFLYVISESRIYPVELKGNVPDAALSHAKPVRNNADLAKLAASVSTTKRSFFSLPRVAGWALLEDNRTLALATPDKAQIVYIDTLEGAELRRVSTDFQPGSMALQGDTLYVVGTNSSVLYAIDT